jgi:hypothetical protein
VATVTTALLAGCPVATGRHRNEPSDGTAGLCLEDASGAFPGAACSISGDTCDTMRSCGSDGIEIDSCTCSGGVWDCTMGPCNRPGPDSGEPMCPPGNVMDQGPCDALQGGLVCTGSGLDCSGNVVELPCYCNGSTWFCSGTECDAGSDGSGICPAMPEPLGACAPGGECDYPTGPCVIRCVCGSDGAFECSRDCAPDAGDGGAADASDGWTSGDGDIGDAADATMAIDAGSPRDF